MSLPIVVQNSESFSKPSGGRSAVGRSMSWKATGQLAKPNEHKRVRKEIARVKTIIAELERQEGSK